MNILRQIYRGFPRVPLYLFLFLTVAAWVLSIFEPFFCYNPTDSMPKGIYFLRPAQDIRRGDIVLFSPPNAEIAALCKSRRYIDDHVLFLKRVGALEGDRYYRQEQDFFIESRAVGKILNKDSAGRDLPHLDSGLKVVSSGCFLPISFAAKSFDARYYGEVPISAIKYKAVPLIVF